MIRNTTAALAFALLSLPALGQAVADEPVQARLQFRVYPSPAEGGASVYVELAGATSGAIYTLRTLMGQAISGGKFKSQTAVLPTSGLAAGTYLVTVQVPGQEPVLKHVLVR